VVERALDELIAKLEARKLGRCASPRSTPEAGRAAGSSSRYIPAAVRRAVCERDGDQCAYVSPAGRRCTERGMLEFHHVQPFARGGGHTVDAIELRCRAHNDYAAVQDFGAEHMRRARRTGVT